MAEVLIRRQGRGKNEHVRRNIEAVFWGGFHAWGGGGVLLEGEEKKRKWRNFMGGEEPNLQIKLERKEGFTPASN